MGPEALSVQFPYSDLFVNQGNSQCPTFVSLMDRGFCCLEDAFLYAVPPLPLIPKALHKFRCCSPCSMILVTQLVLTSFGSQIFVWPQAKSGICLWFQICSQGGMVGRSFIPPLHP